MNVTILIVSNGQGLGQMVAGRSGTGCICFVVAELVFMLCGFVLGQIRTLQRLGMPVLTFQRYHRCANID